MSLRRRGLRKGHSQISAVTLEAARVILLCPTTFDQFQRSIGRRDRPHAASGKRRSCQRSQCACALIDHKCSNSRAVVDTNIHVLSGRISGHEQWERRYGEGRTGNRCEDSSIRINGKCRHRISVGCVCIISDEQEPSAHIHCCGGWILPCSKRRTRNGSQTAGRRIDAVGIDGCRCPHERTGDGGIKKFPGWINGDGSGEKTGGERAPAYRGERSVGGVDGEAGDLREGRDRLIEVVPSDVIVPNRGALPIRVELLLVSSGSMMKTMISPEP